jgi:Ulp1 family protease
MGLQQQIKEKKVDLVIAAYNSNGNHWTSVVMVPQDKEIHYYDSLGKRKCNDKVLQRLVAFMNNFTSTTWTVCMKDAPKQTDGNSCGVFTCM